MQFLRCIPILYILFFSALPLTHTFWLLSDTMMKFASFETIVEMIYKYAIPTPKEHCSKNKQLGVSFAAGYVAGVLCAIVSHPADNLVSFLNNAKGATIGDVRPCIHTYIHTFLYIYIGTEITSTMLCSSV